MSGDPRIEAARQVLERAGLPHASVTAGGHDLSVAIIGGLDASAVHALGALSGRIREAGFRYVTLDITDAEP